MRKRIYAQTKFLNINMHKNTYERKTCFSVDPITQTFTTDAENKNLLYCNDTKKWLILNNVLKVKY